MATWSAFRAQMRRELEESTAGVWSDDSLLWWANEACKDIAIKAKPMRDWSYTTTVAGQSTYDLPTRSLEVIEVFVGNESDDDRYRLERQKFTDWRTLDITDGKPQTYAVDDDSIILRPAPDKAYELSFLRYVMPEDIDDEADNMPFSDRYNAAIGYFVKSRAMEQIQDWHSSDAYLARYNAELDKAMVQETHEANAAYRGSVTSVY